MDNGGLTVKGLVMGGRKHGFILCGTESTKIISTRYKSYGLVDLYQFLHIKCILPAQFLNLPFRRGTTYITIFRSQTHNPQHTTQNNQNGPLPPYPPTALPSVSVSRAAAPTTYGASAPHGPMQDARHRFRPRRCWFPCLGRQRKPHQNIERKKGPWP
jgi:hypothetical protein